MNPPHSILGIGFVLISAACPVLAQTKPARPGFIPEDAQWFRGSWFKLYREKCSWDSARASCANTGGQLAVVPDKEAWDFIKAYYGDNHYWIGATDLEKEGKWKWIDGTPFTYSAWRAGEPNNVNGGEHYLSTGGDAWNDSANSSRWVKGYICQWKYRPILSHDQLERTHSEIALILRQLRQELAAIKAGQDLQFQLLDNNYLNALQKEQERSIARVDLDMLAILKAELQRIKNGEGPGESDEETPPPLAKLRTTYQQQAEKIRKEHLDKTTPVFRKQNPRLEAIRLKLAGDGAIDDSIEVSCILASFSAPYEF